MVANNTVMFPLLGLTRGLNHLAQAAATVQNLITMNDYGLRT